MAAGDLKPRRRQLDPALEMPVRYLQPVNPGVPDLARQRGFAANDQYAGAERHLDLVELHPGQGDQDGQRLLALEDIAGRLPGLCRAAAMEELPIEAVGALHRIARLFPHQRFELLWHIRLPAAVDIVTLTPAGKAPRDPRLGGRRETGYQPLRELWWGWCDFGQRSNRRIRRRRGSRGAAGRNALWRWQHGLADLGQRPAAGSAARRLWVLDALDPQCAGAGAPVHHRRARSA